MSRLVSDEPVHQSLNYSVKLSSLMEYFFLMTNERYAHVRELLSCESGDLKRIVVVIINRYRLLIGCP